jgi:sulfatase maturation enzyme AslB (radical SAM superfamily)
MGRDFITIVIRPVDEACNLACTYCDAAQYSGGEARMADRVLEEIIRQASVPRFRFVSFCWHGIIASH